MPPPTPSDSPSDPSLLAPEAEPDRAEEEESKAPKKESSLNRAARRKFGLRLWDRPALYVETAEAATDTDLPFWSVLLLSGAIATLGLALDATAVVIGAMLVAPLLGPLLGLSLALAVGDGRLAAQTGLTIVLGALGVVALAAFLTLLLPFQDITPEIAARTRPTTLDLGIAVFSGLAGAVVTVSRENRLSASIPGVAIAVALIPPLSVAGFGIGTGFQWGLVRGSLLLFGANLGGIVLSGMAAFLLVGMHGEDVVQRARRWHREADLPGLAGRLSRLRLFSNLRVFESAWMRIALVLAFITAVSVPLTSSLQQVLRETRVQGALAQAAAELEGQSGGAVLSRSVKIGDGASLVRFRVATSAWISERERHAVERTATAAAGEPITLELEQLLASDGDALSEILAPSQPPETASTPAATLDRLRQHVNGALDRIILPDDVRAVGAEVAVSAEAVRVLVAYAAPERLPLAAESMVARQAASALGLPPGSVATELVPTPTLPLPPDSAQVVVLRDLLARFPALRLTVAADSAEAEAVRQSLLYEGIPEAQILTEQTSPPRLQLVVAE